MADSVEPKDAREAIASNEFAVIDVREREEWSTIADRVPGSVHIPADELDDRLDELPTDRRILVVCPDGERSAEVAERIGGGDRDVTVLEGGIKAWEDSKLLTQPSPDADAPKGEDSDR